MDENNEAVNNEQYDSDDCSFPTSGKPPIESKYAPAAVEQADKNDEKIIEQFVENEKNKRSLKPKILIWVCFFVLIQLIIMNAILLTIIGCLAAENSLIWADAAIISEIFEFLKYYITATIVELLGMLYFMIRKVFDNSIIDIFKLNRQEKEQKKRTKKDK